jgi:hypothetical protein
MKRDQGYDSLNQSLIKLQSALQSLSGEYQSTIRDTETDRQGDYSELAAKFAAMGGGPGTAYGKDYGDMTKEYANFGSDLNRWFNEGQQGILQDRTGAITNFNTLIRGLLGMQNQRAAEKAAAAALAKKTAAAKAAAAKKAAQKSYSAPKKSYSAPKKYYSSPKKKYSAPKKIYNKSTNQPGVKYKKKTPARVSSGNMSGGLTR